MKKTFYIIASAAFALAIASCKDSGKNQTSELNSEEIIAGAENYSDPSARANTINSMGGTSGYNQPNSSMPQVTQAEWDEVVNAVTKEIERLNPEDVKNVLDGSMDAMNSNLPLNIGAGMEITSIYIEDNAVQYLVKCDEKVVKIDELKKELDPQNGALKDILLGKDNTENIMFAQLCKFSGYDIIYNFQAIPSQQTYSLRIKNEEL